MLINIFLDSYLERACEQFEQAVAIRMDEFGDKDTCFITALSCLASSYLKLGRYDYMINNIRLA